MKNNDTGSVPSIQRRMGYAVALEEEESGWFTAYFPGLPGATFGENRDECLEQARDLLETILTDHVLTGQDLPIQDAHAIKQGSGIIVMPGILFTLKAALNQEMRRRNITNKTLGSWLGICESNVRRLRNPRHESKIAHMERAIKTMGLTIAPLQVMYQERPL